MFNLQKSTKEYLPEIITFYDSLTVEKQTFNLPLAELLKSDFLVVSRDDTGKIKGISGIRNNALLLVVGAMFQNKGLGQELVSKVIQIAKEKNYAYITLNVFSSNFRAVHIYKTKGFKIIYSFLIGPERKKNYYMILPLRSIGTIYLSAAMILYKHPLDIIVNRFKKIVSLLPLNNLLNKMV